MEEITSQLFSHQDKKYKSFSSKLMPNVNPETVIGVRIPDIRRLAKIIKSKPYCDIFLNELPHSYFEENHLHSFLICDISDFDTCINRLNRFLPFVDNWATCDSIKPKCFKKNKEKLLKEIDGWISSNHTYTVRFGILMLMTHFLDGDFTAGYLQKVANIKSNEYYINMMIAWFFATALAKQWESTLPYIENRILSPWVHKKTVQKAIESFRITDMQKNVLRKLKQ